MIDGRTSSTAERTAPMPWTHSTKHDSLVCEMCKEWHESLLLELVRIQHALTPSGSL